MNPAICRPNKSTAPLHGYPEFTQTHLLPRIGSNGPYLESSVSEKTLVADSEGRLLSVLATLEECRAHLIAGGERETALLVSVAILELQMKLNRITDFELKAFCEAMLPEDAASDRLHDLKSPQGQRRRPLLKLVK